MAKAKRHPKFDSLVKKLAGEIPRAEEAVAGAIWELSKQPKMGFYIAEIDIWQARLRLPPDYSVEVLLL